MEEGRRKGRGEGEVGKRKREGRGRGRGEGGRPELNIHSKLPIIQLFIHASHACYSKTFNLLFKTFYQLFN